MLSFTFGGKDSFIDYGFVIEKRPTISSPKRRVTYIDIPGKNSSIRYDERTYEDITILVECGLNLRGNLIEKLDEIKSWLFNTGESNLVFSFQPDKKYIAQVVNAIDFTQVFKYTSKFPILFKCRPFKYAVQNEEIVIETNGTTVHNPGSIESLPVIELTGSGDIELDINAGVIHLKEVQNKIILNSELEDCYDEEYNNLNSKMLGRFPLFNIGANSIHWTGNVLKLEVRPNWRWL
ncbi:distal tail protein Dit [Alkalihalobacterium bogoriense]|uniref:distal tail protein Dit n=1 Tax=Alkalihalobacterium bogoriense TaxID=246272 RepID=UPI00047A2AF3|nr:distal tail protein Dit [Alkalihalobacterium bogoriense]